MDAKVVAILFVVLVAGCVSQGDYQSVETGQIQEESGAGQYAPGCKGSGPVDLTFSPMDPEKIEYIAPMGLMIGGHVTPIDHQYYYEKSGLAPYEVRTPAAGVVTSIQAMPGSNNDDYRIYIHHTCTFYTIYIHVNELAPKLKNAVGSLTSGQSKATNIELEAGEVFATLTNQYLSFDFQLQNEDVMLPGFIVPEHYDGEPWKIHTVDPFDYFAEPLRSDLLAKTPRTAEPRGGKIDYDVDGRLIGNWFVEGTNGYAGTGPSGCGDEICPYWATHLAFAPDAYDPTHFIVSIGDFDGEAKQFSAHGNAPDPADVSVASALVKYELVSTEYKTGDEFWDRRSFATDLKVVEGSGVQGTILVQMLSDRRLKAEVFVGKTASQVSGFTSAAKVYER